MQMGENMFHPINILILYHMYEHVNVTVFIICCGLRLKLMISVSLQSFVRKNESDQDLHSLPFPQKFLDNFSHKQQSIRSVTGV